MRAGLMLLKILYKSTLFVEQPRQIHSHRKIISDFLIDNSLKPDSHV